MGMHTGLTRSVRRIQGGYVEGEVISRMLRHLSVHFMTTLTMISIPTVRLLAGGASTALRGGLRTATAHHRELQSRPTPTEIPAIRGGTWVPLWLKCSSN